MEENKTAADAPIDLGAESVWARFTLAGVQFEVEIFEASDMLADIDRKHIADPHTCMNKTCGQQFQVPPEMFGETDEYRCPKCGGDKIQVSQVFLDDVKILLRDKFGVTRCARGEAARFYNAIIQATEDQKKSIMTRLESDIGSTLTQADGEQPKGEPT